MQLLAEEAPRLAQGEPRSFFPSCCWCRLSSETAMQCSATQKPGKAAERCISQGEPAGRCGAVVNRAGRLACAFALVRRFHPDTANRRLLECPPWRLPAHVQSPKHSEDQANGKELFPNAVWPRPLSQTEMVNHVLEVREELGAWRVQRTFEAGLLPPKFGGHKRPTIWMLQQPVRVRLCESRVKTKVGTR